jgi:hypothetical protein
MMQKARWIPLQDTSGRRCTIWDYDQDDPRWAIYRFVWNASDITEVVFYVGSGLNLSSPRGTTKSLKYQYLNGNRKIRLRLPMQKELSEKGGEFWTEVLDPQDAKTRNKLDAECIAGAKTQLEIVENCFIYLSFLDYLSDYQVYGDRMFNFYNLKIDRLPEVAKLLARQSSRVGSAHPHPYHARG